MTKNMNVAHFIGRLGKSAVSQSGSSGTVYRFPIAVGQDWGEEKSTMWINAAYWSAPAGLLPFLTKGKKVRVSGRLGFDKKTGTPRVSVGTDGTVYSYFDLNVTELELLGDVASSVDSVPDDDDAERIEIPEELE
jgi:hypothetical protein